MVVPRRGVLLRLIAERSCLMYVPTLKLSKYLTRECNHLGSSITIRDDCGIKGAIYVYLGYAVSGTTAVVRTNKGVAALLSTTYRCSLMLMCSRNAGCKGICFPSPSQQVTRLAHVTTLLHQSMQSISGTFLFCHRPFHNFLDLERFESSTAPRPRSSRVFSYHS